LRDEINQLAAANRDFNEMLGGLQQQRNTAIRELEYAEAAIRRSPVARPVAPRLLHGATLSKDAVALRHSAELREKQLKPLKQQVRQLDDEFFRLNNQQITIFRRLSALRALEAGSRKWVCRASRSDHPAPCCSGRARAPALRLLQEVPDGAVAE